MSNALHEDDINASHRTHRFRDGAQTQRLGRLRPPGVKCPFTGRCVITTSHAPLANMHSLIVRIASTHVLPSILSALSITPPQVILLPRYASPIARIILDQLALSIANFIEQGKLCRAGALSSACALANRLSRASAAVICLCVAHRKIESRNK